MLRTFLSISGGFFLVFVECYLVLLINKNSIIEFGGIGPFISIWAMNFFLLFTILTHIKLWKDEKEERNNSFSH